MTNDMYLRIKQVTAVTGLSRATIYNMMAAGKFPMQTALGDRAVGWLSSEIQHWMTARKSVEKTGLEANPARRNSVRKTSLVPRILQSGATLVEPAVPSVNKRNEWSDWGDDPGPTVAEKQAISDRLRLNNAMRKQKVRKEPLAKARGKTFSIIGGRAQPASAEDRSVAGQADPSKSSAKRKT